MKKKYKSIILAAITTSYFGIIAVEAARCMDQHQAKERQEESYTNLTSKSFTREAINDYIIESFDILKEMNPPRSINDRAINNPPYNNFQQWINFIQSDQNDNLFDTQQNESKTHEMIVRLFYHNIILEVLTPSIVVVSKK